MSADADALRNAYAEGHTAGERKGLRDVADRLDGEAHRLPVLAEFAVKFRDRAARLGDW